MNKPHNNNIEEKDLDILTQTYGADTSIDAMILYRVSLMEKNWKFIYTLLSKNNNLELYNLSNDPDELTNLAMSNKEKTRELSNSLKEYKFSELSSKYSLKGIDKKSKEILKSLGYFQ